ncbi:MAG: DNA-directed RNA polymerase subunit N [Nitrososphaerota archaeon]|jgi:DNA-directed RNA polymerase I, II, and III subunit RPABC5|nr:DNA-directed RNA polymerase subunit N [Nitrososphaerota archaeon]MDG7036956.1 DNA-directed RNA polymerase subunit N [Nitrososphaerota archaeon]MDG7038256.1 DNA-directed RNA polymerase subunit N [Nitrososphaerota archaeon]MDG7040608.1 DNA-directed RNA polymerase subunit N [Nitrososphaerota archaeon]MDG7042520.1 DNA-directed RNA polymerase subunit N [Nitrososphaerota archaeon]
MLVPVRCFSCGSVIGDKYEKFRDLVQGGMKEDEALDKLEIKRYCCRRMVLSNFNVMDQLIPYAESVYRLKLQQEED